MNWIRVLARAACLLLAMAALVGIFIGIGRLMMEVSFWFVLVPPVVVALAASVFVEQEG